MWHSGFLRRLSNPASDFIDDYIVVGGVPAQQTTKADDRVVFAGLSQ